MLTRLISKNKLTYFVCQNKTTTLAYIKYAVMYFSNYTFKLGEHKCKKVILFSLSISKNR